MIWSSDIACGRTFMANVGEANARRMMALKNFILIVCWRCSSYVGKSKKWEDPKCGFGAGQYPRTQRTVFSNSSAVVVARQKKIIAKSTSMLGYQSMYPTGRNYNATGIVTVARWYRAGRAVVFLPYVLHHLHDESKNIAEIIKMF
jgi:hypothetical protein